MMHWTGAAELDGLLVPLEQMRLDPANARRHGARNLHAIRDSLAQFGQVKPIVLDPDGTILAGNGTWEAARGLGWTHLAAVTYPADAAAAVRRAYAILDNRSAELSDW